MRVVLPVLLVTLALISPAVCQEPPIQSPQDAACRDQARAEVFSAPNPNRLSPWDLGSQIWHTCMASYHGRGPNPDRQERRF